MLRLSFETQKIKENYAIFWGNLKVFFENLKVFFWLSRFLAGIIFYTREVLLTSHYEK